MTLNLVPDVGRPVRRDLVRVIWRVSGPLKIAEACVYCRDNGYELAVQWSEHEIFLTELYPADDEHLEARAERLHDAVLAAGFMPVP